MTLIRLRIWLLQLIHRTRPAPAQSRRRLARGAVQQLEDRVLLVAPVQQTLIDFEDLSSFGSIANLQQSHQSYWTGAYGMTGAFSVVGSESTQSYSGSTAASFGTSGGALARYDRQPFSLKSLDVSTLVAEQNNASLIFYGTKADGTRLTQGAVADGLTARRQDFVGFDDLISVEWSLNSGSSGVQLDNILVTSVATSMNNSAPNISSHAFSLNENAVSGTIVGQLAATGATTFQIVAGNSSNAFTISPAGELKVANAAAIDFEYRTKFQLVVKAIRSQSFSNSAWDAAVITVDVRDVLNDRTILTPVVDGQRNGSTVITDGEIITVLGTTIGLFEFSMAGINRMQIFDTSLSVYIDPAGDLSTFRVYAYAGDGVISATDPTGGGVLVASFTPREFGWNNISLSRSALATLIPQLTTGYLGFSLTTASPYIDPKIRANEHLTGGARLSLGLRPNNAPVVDEVAYFVSENSGLFSGGNQLTATDADAGDTVTWSMVSSTLPGAFSVDVTGKIIVDQPARLDYEKTKQVRLTVRATDNGLIPRTDTGVIVINILDVNEAPLIVDQALTVTQNVRPLLYLGRVVASDPENSGLTYSLSNPYYSSPYVTVDSAGMIRWTDRLINLTSGQKLASNYSIFVTATDKSGLARTARVTVNLTMTQTSPTPAAIPSVSLPEHSAVGTFIATATASDPDPGATLTYTISDANSPFRVDRSTGRIVVRDSSKLNHEAWGSWNYVDVSDGIFQVRVPFHVTLIDRNTPPSLADATISVAEFSPVGTLVHTLIATDPDRIRQTIKYTIVSGNIDGVFIVDAATGRLTVSKPEVLNGITRPSYRLVVRATDSGSPALSDTAIITIGVVPAELKVRQYSDIGAPVGIIRTNSVPEADRTYSIVSGNAGDAFAVSDQGLLTVANPAAIQFLDQAQFRLVTRITSGSVATNVVTLVNVIVDHPRWLSAPVTGYGQSQTAPDANGVRQWQPPTQPEVQTVQGGPGVQSRVTLRFGSSQYLSRATNVAVSLRVFETVRNEVDDATIPIDIYIVPQISNTSNSALNREEFLGGWRVGKLVLTAGDISENRIHVIQLDADAIKNFTSSYYNYNSQILTLSFRNDTNSNAVRFVASNSTSATASSMAQLHVIVPGPEPTNVLYIDRANSDFPAVHSLYSSGPDYQSRSLNLTASRYWTAGTYDTFLKILGQRADGSWWSAYSYSWDQISAWESQFSMPVPIIPETGVGLTSGDWGGVFAARDEAGGWWLASSAYFSNADHWHIAGNWSPDVNWSDVQVADFDGDGSDDIAGRDPVTGQWTVSRSVFPTNNSQQQSFTTSIWGRWSVGTDWTKIVTGDFNGDGRADLLGQTSTGEWWLSRSTGLGFAAAVLVGTWDASDPLVEVLSGDFNGDLRDDLIARTVSGTWLLGTTTFSGLDTRVLGHWIDTDGWDQSLLVRYPSWDNSSQLVVASRNRRTNEIWMLEPTDGVTQIRNLGAQGGTPMQRLGASQVSDQPLPVTAPIPQGPLLNPVRSAQPGIVDTPTPGTPVTITNNTTPVGGAAGVTKALTPPAFRGATYSYSSSISSGNTLLADNDVFVRVGSNWVYQATLVLDIVDYWHVSSQAMHGNIVAIGDTSRGEVYVFERTGNLWTQTARLRNDTAQGGQYWSGFGRSLAVQENELFVADTARRVVLVYQRTTGGWLRQTELPVPEFVNYSQPMFAVDGDRLALGSASGYESSFVLAFERQSGVWIRSATIRPSSPNYFSRGLTLSGNTLAIQGSGAAYIYEYSDSTWLWTATLPNGGTSPTRPAAIAGDRLVTYSYRTGVSNVTQLYQRSATSWILMQEWANARPMSFDGRTLVLQPTSYYSGGPLTVVTLATPLRPVLTDRTFTIPERLGAGQTVGTMDISNPGPVDRTIYTIISGNAADVFRIDAATGRISVKRPERLTFETSPVVTLRIRVVREGLAAYALATIQLQDIDDGPIRLVDDGDADFSISSGSIARSGYLNDSRMFRQGTGNSQATWTFPGLIAGTYRVMATWRIASTRATNSPFTILDGQQLLTTVQVNQQVAPAGTTYNRTSWQTLGEFRISGGELTVNLTNFADGEVVADAIMIERIGLLPQTPKISVIWSGTLHESGDVLDFGEIDFSEQAERSFVITNSGAADLTLQPVIPPAGFTVVKNLSTEQRLGPGDSATVVLRYSASDLTAQSGVLTVLSGDPDQPEFRINVSASRPQLILGEAAIFVDGSEVPRGSGIVDFGDAPFDTTKTKTVTVLNRGPGPLYLLEPQVIFNGWAPGVSGTPGFEVTHLSQQTLAPGETATFSVSISAVSSGVFVRRISLPVSGYPSDGEVFFMVRAAVNSPEIDVIVNSSTVTSGIDFGVTSLGVTVEREFVLKNPGAAPLVLQPASITGDFEIVNNVTSGQVINPGDEYALRVRFKATAMFQSFGQLVIRSNDLNESTLTYALTATVGAARVEVTLSRPGYGYQTVSDGGTFDWGSVSQGSASETRILTIRNDGNQDLILQPITIPAGFSIVGNNLVAGQRIARFASATVTLRLDTSSAGRRSGEVSMGTNDPDSSPFNFLMRAAIGTVIDVTMAVNGAAVSEYARADFGTLTYGTSVTKTFTVTNQGDIPLTLQPATVPSGFTLVTNTTANQILKPGQSATLLVRFAAVTASSVGGYLILPTNDSNEGSFLLYLTGGLILGGNPVVTFNGAPLTPDAVIDFGRVSLGVAPIRTLHLSNPTSEAILIAPWSGSSSVFILDDAGAFLMPPGSTASIRIQMVADVLGERSVTIYPIGTGRVYFPINTKITGRAFGEIDVNVSGVPVANQEIYDLGRDLPGTLTVRTLTVRNKGTSVLRLMPAVLAASGSYQPRFLSNFSRGQAVAVGATASILVEFPASQVGEYQWTISFGNSDADESSYGILFQRSVLADAPEITATFDGVDLPDNTGYLDFGSTYIGRPVSRKIIVSNIGFKDLIVQPISVPGGFTAVRNFTANQVIAPGQSWALEIRMDALVLASRSGQAAFLTNDANERPFDFHMSGSVIDPPTDWQFTIDDRDSGFTSTGAWGVRIGGVLVPASDTATQVPELTSPYGHSMIWQVASTKSWQPGNGSLRQQQTRLTSCLMQVVYFARNRSVRKLIPLARSSTGLNGCRSVISAFMRGDLWSNCRTWPWRCPR
jgi:hypothetical protein